MALKEKKCINCSVIIEYSHKNKPVTCPYCGALYWDKPKDERDLFLLQDAYIESGRSNKYLGQIYLKLVEYSKNIIKHKLRNKVILSQEDFDSKAEEIALIMTERYLKKSDEKINHSFGGMMMWIANGVLYSGKKDDKIESLNVVYSDSNKEFIENIYHFSSSEKITQEENDPQNKLHHIKDINLLSKEILNIIDMIYSRIHKKQSSSNLLFLLGLNYFFVSKKNSFFQEFNSLISTSLKRDLEKTKLVIRNYLKEQY